MERVMGIEPTQPAWKAGILPLNNTRTFHSHIIPQLFLLVKHFSEKDKKIKLSSSRPPFKVTGIVTEAILALDYFVCLNYFEISA